MNSTPKAALAFLAIGLFVVFLGVLYLYQSFLLNFTIAALLCIATYENKKMLEKRIGNAASSTLIMLILALFVLVPFGFIFYKTLDFIQGFSATQIVSFFDKIKITLQDLLSGIPFISEINSSLNSLDFEALVSKSFAISSFLATKSFNFITDAMFILIFMAVLFFYGRVIYLYILGLMPFKMKVSNAVFIEIRAVIKVVLFSSLINIILQGLAFFVIANFLDFNSAVLLGVLYGILSLVPVVGGVLVWGPCALYLVYLGDIRGAVLITLYSLIFIAFVIDNLIKPYIIKLVSLQILKQKLRLNEIFIFFAIFAGLVSFGFWGIIIGPALSSMLIALLELYKRYFVRKQQTKRD